MEGGPEIRSTIRVGESSVTRSSREDEPHLIARMPDHELWMTFFRGPDRDLDGPMSEVRT